MMKQRIKNQREKEEDDAAKESGSAEKIDSVGFKRCTSGGNALKYVCNIAAFAEIRSIGFN